MAKNGSHNLITDLSNNVHLHISCHYIRITKISEVEHASIEHKQHGCQSKTNKN